MKQLTRRHFGALAAATLTANLTRSLWAREAVADPSGRRFTFALITDTHIIDEFYVKGSENGVEDNESILHTSERLTMTRDLINSLEPRVEKVFVLGDYFHNYPSTEYDFYFKNRTRIDNAKAITDKFTMPVHLLFGNHDYDARRVDREMSHRLFKAKLGADPYSAVDYKGWKFICANNFLGSTWDRHSADFHPSTGSLGETQLLWLEAQLAERKPTFVFLHYPLLDVQDKEFKDFGLHPLLRKYQDTVRLVVTGHYHKWLDYAHTYGPQHYVMAATRYDANALMLMDVDTQTGEWRWVNRDLVEWSTHFAKPYRKA
jgi:hypothetical protein